MPVVVAAVDQAGRIAGQGSGWIADRFGTKKIFFSAILLFSLGSRLLALDAQQRPAFIAALNSLGQGSVVPAPGGVLIRDQAGAVLGAIGISGDTSDIDEQCAITAIEGVGLLADAGVSA